MNDLDPLVLYAFCFDGCQAKQIEYCTWSVVGHKSWNQGEFPWFLSALKIETR